jgi:regulator of protease activity HflC (stomatin/prohibitin superfamily)
MNYFKEVLDYLSKIFQWWVIVEPWEAGLRVRFGKRIKLLEGGIYFRIPFFDAVFIQETRMRMISINPQTVTSKDGKTITIFSSVGYSIRDIKKLYVTIAQPDSTIANTVLSAIADHVSSNEALKCFPADIESAVQNKLKSTDYGISFEHIKVTGYSVVRTYRLIQDGSWVNDGINLTTRK